MKCKSLFLFFTMLSFCVVGQSLLSKEEALAITLENNFGIKVANNNLDIAKNNASIYNSGYLPSASVSSGIDYSRDNQNFVFTDSDTGGDRELGGNGVVSKNYSATVAVNYLIFDGLGRKYSYEQLKESYNLSEIQAKATIENTYLQLFTNYFQIARLTENTSNLKKALSISKTRLKRAEYQYEFGQTTRLEMLNAKVDVNNDSIAYLNSKQELLTAKIGLNVILGVEQETQYKVDTIVGFENLYNIDELQEKTLQNNVQLQQSKKNIAISEFNIKINKAAYLPTVDFDASYGFNRTENENLINPFGAKLITSDGLNAGVSLSWSIFDGGSTRTQIANAKIEADTQKVLLEEQKITIKNQVQNIWASYRNQLFVLSAQEENVATNENNFERTEERYKLGQVTSLEFRQAQTNLVNAQTALNNAKYDAKLLELQLLQLSGDILNVKL
ncbi:TolC family protein [Polaribacter sp.]|nr:TolC family protein [Polaribacter sp.]